MWWETLAETIVLLAIKLEVETPHALAGVQAQNPNQERVSKMLAQAFITKTLMQEEEGFLNTT